MIAYDMKIHAMMLYTDIYVITKYGKYKDTAFKLL